MTSLRCQLLISFSFNVGWSHNLVKEIWVVHVKLGSYKISCDIDGHLDILQWISSFVFYIWIEPQFVQSALGSPCDFRVIENILRPWRSPWHLGSMARSMYILSLSFDLSIHNSAKSWPRYSNYRRWKRNSLFLIYYVINIFQLEYLRYLLSNWDQNGFGKSRMAVTFFS